MPYISFASLLQAAMIPITNTLIATNVSRERRGTGFGIASSAQALALMAGPIAAAALGAAFDATNVCPAALRAMAARWLSWGEGALGDLGETWQAACAAGAAGP